MFCVLQFGNIISFERIKSKAFLLTNGTFSQIFVSYIKVIQVFDFITFSFECVSKKIMYCSIFLWFVGYESLQSILKVGPFPEIDLETADCAPFQSIFLY